MNSYEQQYQARQQARLFFDIETLANPENCALMPEPVIEAPSNYKDPEKISQYIAEKTEAAKSSAIEKAALDPDYGKILSIGYATSPDGPIKVLIAGEIYFAELDPNGSARTEYVFTEQDLITEFWKALAFCNGNAVGYNILGFDIPYIMRRSMALGIKVPFIPNLAKFRTDPITDLMAIIYNWGSQMYKGLKLVAKLYKIANDCPDVDGSQVKDLSPRQLREYQISDVKLTQALYKKMNGIYFKH